MLLFQETTTTDDDIFQGVRDFFDSDYWIVGRNVGLFFAVTFWLALAYWVYKDARRRIEDPWLIAVAVALGIFPPFVGPLVYMLFRPPSTSTTFASASSRSARWKRRSGETSSVPCAAPRSTRASSPARSAPPS